MLLLVACAPDPAPGESPPEAHSSVAGDTAALPSPWSWSGETAEEATVSPEVVEQVLAEALLAIPTIDPFPFMDAWLTAQTFATGECPDFADSDGLIYWVGDCTSGRGFTFDGWAVSNWDRNVAGPGGEACADLLFLYAFGSIAYPEGPAVDAWGSMSYTDCVATEGVRTIDAFVDGWFQFPLAKGAWFEVGRPVELYWSASDTPGQAWLELRGGFVDLGEDIYGVWLDDLRFDPQSACLSEPTGAVRMWTPAGAELALSFDPEVACDGCAELRQGDATLGSVCVDFGPYFAWEDRPWW